MDGWIVTTRSTGILDGKHPRKIISLREGRIPCRSVPYGTIVHTGILLKRRERAAGGRALDRIRDF